MDKILSKAFKSNDAIEKEIDELSEIVEKEMTLEIIEKENKIEIIDNKLINPILEEYKQKYKPEELTDDGIPTIETQLKEMKIKDEEIDNKMKENIQKTYNREMTQRVKCLSLIKLGLSAFTNTNDLSMREKTKLQKIMYEYNDIEHDIIVKQFNEEIGDMLDDTKSIDYSKLPVYYF
jgi:hypothetical protein